MSNVLSDEKRQQILALGRLGWPLRRIERATGVRRETASAYLKAAEIYVRPPGGWGHRAPAKPANQVTIDSDPANPVSEVVADSHSPKPANEVTTDSGSPDLPSEPIPYPNNTLNSKRSVSNCEPYRDVIELGLERGRNAMAIWQELVTEHGFERGYQSVKRFVHKVRPVELRLAHPVIVTAPGEEAQVDYGTGPMVRDPIDLLSCLVSDELTRRSDRLLERRRKQAGFRDQHTTLDNFDFSFNKKMNRSMVFDLATANFIARREDALFLGPPGTEKSHLAQAIGQAVIQQGHKVLYRETHVLLDELADATLDGTRREYMEWIVSLPLLILDDLGMRKLPPDPG
jgi:hypothetical protein